LGYEREHQQVGQNFKTAKIQQPEEIQMSELELLKERNRKPREKQSGKQH